MQQGSLAPQPRPAAGRNKPANSRAGVRLHCQRVRWARYGRAVVLSCLIFGVDVSADAASVFVARRGWHIDVGFAVADLTAPLNVIAAKFPGSRYVFFGFGDRQYLHAAHRGAPILLRALWPGQGLVLATALGAAPTAAFGRDSVVELKHSRKCNPSFGLRCHHLSAALSRDSVASEVYQVPIAEVCSSTRTPLMTPSTPATRGLRKRCIVAACRSGLEGSSSQVSSGDRCGSVLPPHRSANADCQGSSSFSTAACYRSDTPPWFPNLSARPRWSSRVGADCYC